MSSGPLVIGLGELLWDILPSGREIGGAPANFAYHAGCLGARGAVVSRVGDDAFGREIVERLSAAGIDVANVSFDPKHPTGTVTVELKEGGKPLFTIHRDTAWDYLEMSEAATESLRRADAVCFGTLARRSPVSAGAIDAFLRAASPGCLKVFDVNLRQDFFNREILESGLRVSSVLKLSDEELPVVAGLLSIRGEEREAAGDLAGRYGLKAVAVTRGERGCLLVSGREAVEHPGFRPERLASTVGAGDAFAAVLVLGLLRGLRTADICERANRLASYVCSQPGGMPPIPEDLRAVIAA